MLELNPDCRVSACRVCALLVGVLVDKRGREAEVQLQVEGEIRLKGGVLPPGHGK